MCDKTALSEYTGSTTGNPAFKLEQITLGGG